MNLMKNTLPSEVLAPIAAASNTDEESDIVDMSGYEGVAFITLITDCTATGVATQTIEQNTANSTTGMAALSGATATVTSTAGDDLNGHCLVVDVYKPLERYLQAVITSTIAEVAFGSTIAIRYKGRKAPITKDTTVSAITTVISPSEA